MFIPTKDCMLEMTPTAFEKYSLEILHQQTKGLENFELEHNVVVKKSDGNYQIDGILHFDVMGMRYTTLVECKHYKTPINREKVQVLYDKIRALGAHKGILISTSNFQSGAIKYAKEHGIALIQIVDADLTYETRGQINVVINHPNMFNNGNPYIGIMQASGETGGVTCKYLRYGYTYIKDFLLDLGGSENE